MLIISSNTNKSQGAYTAQIEAFRGNYSPVNIKGIENQQTITGDFAQPITIQAEDITSVFASGTNFTPAENPELPQSGEYLWNPYSQELQIFSENFPRSIQVAIAPEEIPVIPPLLPEPYPLLFKNLPLEGNIQLNRSFENHPSATAELEIALPKSTIQQILSPGLEVDIYGVPLRIENLDITELPRAIYPDMRCRVNINFGGKWENYTEESVFLRDDGSNNLALDNQPDPDCSTGVANNTTNSDRETTVPKLLRRAGIGYIGPILKKVDIPIDTPRDATANPVSLLQERVRIASGFIRWSNPRGVEAARIDGGAVWEYKDGEILGEINTSYDAIDKGSRKQKLSIADYNPPQPDLINFPLVPTPPPIPQLRNELPTNLSFEYPNVELTGEFSRPSDSEQERTQGNSEPRWVRKEPKRELRIDGNVNANLFPDGTTSIQVMSMCFDLGGTTESRQFVYLEDEAEVRIITEIWGFIFTAAEIYDDSRKRIIGNPAEQWELIKQTTTEFTYDRDTGYLLYETERGFNTVRFRKEDVEVPETLILDAGDSELNLYQFFQIPIFKRTSRYLQKFEEYSIENAIDWVKRCDRFGKAFLLPIYNPNFAPPYYALRDRAESTGFATTSNPENEGLGDSDRRNPDLVVGEESLFENRTKVVPVTYEEIFLGEGEVLRGEELTPQKFYTYQNKYKAQGEGMTEALQEASTTEGTGDPLVAKRRPARYIREEKNPQNKQPEAEVSQYRYLLQTQGYSYNDPIGGSENFSVAETLQEALTGARTKLAIENWRNGFQENLQIPGNLNIKEGDRFNYLCNGEYRQRVVISVSHSLEILGLVEGERKITAITSLSLGRYFLPPLSISRHPIPQEGEQEPLNGVAVLVWRKNLGRILPLEGRHRKNP